MRIELRKFGEVLTSRPAGREAFAAIRPILDPEAAAVEVDFSGVVSLSPSWADEFFEQLKNMYGGKVTYLPTDNPSVVETLRVLEEH